jgi:hypothetical protein
LGPGAGQNGITASQVITSGSTQILYLDPGSSCPTCLSSQVDTFAEPTTLREYGPDVVAADKRAFVSANEVSALAESTGSAEPGTLRARAIARIHRRDLTGRGDASVSTSAAFVDVLTVGDNGNPHGADSGVDFRIELAMGGLLGFSSPFAFGHATARAQVWLFPFESGVLPPPGISINGQYYQSGLQLLSSDGTSTNPTLTLGTFDRLEPNSRYWIFAILEVQANVEHTNIALPVTDASARADFFGTVHLFIDPSPNNPGATYTTASGLSYLTPLAAVPEPSLAVLWLFGLALVGTRLGCRANQRGAPADQ